ncbi:hypothetical protein ACFP2T_30420 [Plantactinospora solaniradicis]|uniref:Uncharacterized protein n=1 Tax=Plantactinospora solaniradicis TaxID=1723736 RepID=A0ABW1KH70_9ACTN
MEMSDADQVWNRACASECAGTGPGDRHLWALLRVHGAVMSGGVGFAADVCSPEEFARSADASRYFGLPHLSRVIARVARSSPEEDEELQAAYDELVPLDQVLADAFERRYRAAPLDFAPL